MKYLKKNEKEIKEIKSYIKSKATEIMQKLLLFDTNKHSFIELELSLCDKLNKLGADILEQLIPMKYGDGYRGSRVEVDEETIYTCVSKKRERGLITAFGKINISRAVYTEYNTGGTKSFLDEKLDIENKRKCPLTRYWSDLLGVVAPFEEAQDTLNKIRGIKVSAKQVEISTEKMAKNVTEKHEEQIKDIILDEKGKIKPAKVKLNINAEHIVYIETDGCQIHTHNGWKECKTFMIFETDKITENEYRLKNKKYYSTMKDVGELKRQLKYHIEKYCGNEEIKIVVIGDGAKWIWNMCKELFPPDKNTPRIVEIVDYFHATEKLGDIKKEIFSDKEKGKWFYDDCEKQLINGNIEYIEQTLEILKNEQQSLEKKRFIDERILYFMKNKDKMKYSTYRRQGLCIGSGAIESANKYVIQRRLKLQGMIWNEDNANYMVHLRSEYINQEMDIHYNIHSNPLLNTIAAA